MQKILLLIFIAFCSIIIYQMILGQNGILESYRLDEEKKNLFYTKDALLGYKDKLRDYLDFLKKNKNALRLLALQLGYSSSKLNLIKIIKNYGLSSNLNAENVFIERMQSDFISAQKKKTKQFDKKLKRYRIVFSVIFYVFFGGFAILVILGIHKYEE